jgi:hypothetical protein
VDEAVSAAIVVIAVPWDRVGDAVPGLNWNSRIVIDATNDWAADDLQRRTSSELADLVTGARLVKAANTLSAEVLGSDPHQAGGRRVIFVSGDDTDAKAEVAGLFEDAGFAAIDLGDLVTGRSGRGLDRAVAGVPEAITSGHRPGGGPAPAARVVQVRADSAAGRTFACACRARNIGFAVVARSNEQVRAAISGIFADPGR